MKLMSTSTAVTDSCMPASNWRDGLPVLMTGGCVVREPQLSDAPLLLEALAHEDITRFLPDTPQTIPQFEWFIARIQRERRAGRCLCFTIVPNEPGRPVGLIQIRPRESSGTTAEWGFAIGRDYWGQRLFGTSARLVVDYLFRQTEIRRLESRVLLHNGRANRALEKLGAVVEGILRKSFITRWQSADQVLWALVREDWVAKQSGPTYVSKAPLVRAPEEAAHITPAAEVPTSLQAGLPVLRGEAVRMREAEPRDAADLLRMFEDLYVTRFLPPPPQTVGEFEQFINWSRRQRAAGECACFVVEPDDTGAVSGFFQLRRLDPTFQTAEWGFALASSRWGTGLFHRCADRMLEFAFQQLGVQRMEARVPISNRRAAAALRKLGAIREGRLRRSFLLGDECLDDAMWAIVVDDWSARRTESTASHLPSGDQSLGF